MRNFKLLLCFIFVGHFSFAIECKEVLEKVINAYEAENSTAKRIKEGTIPTAKILSHQNLGEIQENHFLKIPSLSNFSSKRS